MLSSKSCWISTGCLLAFTVPGLHSITDVGLVGSGAALSLADSEAVEYRQLQNWLHAFQTLHLLSCSSSLRYAHRLTGSCAQLTSKICLSMHKQVPGIGWHTRKFLLLLLLCTNRGSRAQLTSKSASACTNRGSRAQLTSKICRCMQRTKLKELEHGVGGSG